ncbi:putative alpha-kinase family protein [Lyophyllum shimeji]|uniref:Alpha-kinase family protein n=1 Tax=Lyophyllum shimeji TaxID=47721 RepID=A0A9P3PRL4_LYOSH|nr:putative alpha-kinase family protein [Lyophyllum shimeji]
MSSYDAKKTAFLLEEVIDTSTEGPFRKYLNNTSPVPLAMETKADEERAKFLAFTQHVQYWKTKKQAFVSDYQGGRSLLTDPQISSSGTLGPIFADGNIPTAHRNFGITISATSSASGLVFRPGPLSTTRMLELDIRTLNPCNLACILDTRTT